MNTTRTIPFLLLAMFCLTGQARGPVKATIGFYNTENLFDTIPAKGYDDSEYTPGGRNMWNTRRYVDKVRCIARVIDDMALDVVGLAEVEGEGVVRDIVMALRTDYNYVCLPSGDTRGMDIALLYKGDKFLPEEIKQVPAARRKALYVRGTLAGHRVDIVVCHMPSLLNGSKYRTRAMENLYGFARRLRDGDPGARLVIMGDFNAAPGDKVMKRTFHTGRQVMDGGGFLFNPLAVAARRGMGSYVWDGRWVMFDNILLDIGFLSPGGIRYREAGVFVRDYLLDGGGAARKGWPLRTFSGGRYLGGSSDHLPVYAVFEVAADL